LEDWLPESHLARFVAQVVGELDLEEIYAEYGRSDGRGKAAYHPLMMVRLLVYCYATGTRSSRRIERASYEDVAVRYLCSNQHPDHDTIAAFRQQHLEALAKLFIQVLALCHKAGLVKLGQVSIDGSKLAANASRQRSVTYETLSEREREWAERVAGLLAEAEQSDAVEDARHGAGARGDELPEELRTASAQLAKIRVAKQELEREARQKAEQAGREREAQNRKPRDEAQKKRWQRSRSETPASDSQANLTDPESRVMVDGATKSFLQAYNAQLAVDGEHQIILAQTVTNAVVDHQQLPSMLAKVEANVGRTPDLITADSGYWSEWELQQIVDRGVNLLVAPDQVRRKAPGELPPNAKKGPLAKRMRERLRSVDGRMQYSQRQATVEPVFAWIKTILGYRRFLLRGLRNAQGEWSLICAALNLRRLHRLQPAQAGT